MSDKKISDNLRSDNCFILNSGFRWFCIVLKYGIYLHSTAVVPKLFEKRPQFQEKNILKNIATPIMYKQFAKKYVLQQKQHVYSNLVFALSVNYAPAYFPQVSEILAWFCLNTGASRVRPPFDCDVLFSTHSLH